MTGGPLTTNSSRPLYEQMVDHLRAAVSAGKFSPGERLPSEAMLCEEYGVSRITVRRAVKELVEDNLLETRQGKGIYVAEPKMTVAAMALNGFSGFGKAGHPDARVRIVRKKHRPPTAKEARLLEIGRSDTVCELARVLYLGKNPFMYDRSIFAEARFPGMLDAVEEKTSTYEMMDKVYGLDNKKITKEITMSVARQDETELLSCKLGDRLFCIEKVARDRLGAVNHLSILLCVASRIKLTLEYEKT